jgi:protein SCO1/2
LRCGQNAAPKFQGSDVTGVSQAGVTPGTHTMDHSAGTFIFDPQRRLREYESHGRGPDVLADDIRELLKAPA